GQRHQACSLFLERHTPMQQDTEHAANPQAKEPAWPHAPEHRLWESGVYFVTAGTYLKHHYFRGADRLAVLHRGLLTVARDYGWRLEAWAVFSNHYHFVGCSPEEEQVAESLSLMLGQLHEKTAKWLN